MRRGCKPDGNGPSAFGGLPGDPERERNEQAWALFKNWAKPFLTLFSNR